MRQMRPFLVPVAALAATLAFSGCSFGPKVPPVLMRLTPDAQIAASGRTAPAAQAITVVPPTAPAELN
ncbi:MAG TPA: ABC transporter, partial [Allosphingosinicella sp.]